MDRARSAPPAEAELAPTVTPARRGGTPAVRRRTVAPAPSSRLHPGGSPARVSEMADLRRHSLQGARCGPALGPVAGAVPTFVIPNDAAPSPAPPPDEEPPPAPPA